MSAPEVYQQIGQVVNQYLRKVRKYTRTRLQLCLTGMLHGKTCSPAGVATAIHQLSLTNAKPESIERQIRRLENDPQVEASLCFHPLARAHLRLGKPQELLLIVDPTLQEDRLVMLAVSVWYRGRALPLAWAVWPGNTPLEGEGFWQRTERVLDEVAGLLPANVPVTVLADRAFGSPAFIDLVTARGWHFVVRVQGQTVCRDRQGRERSVQSLVAARGQRAKLRGQAFKKRGWREVSVVALWGRGQDQPLIVVSDLKPGWELIRLYRRRYPIEATFRHYKTYGWRWEQGQVRDQAHVERLLVCMALATWIVLLVGTWVAAGLLAKPPTGRRRTTPWEGKRSLFRLGLDQLQGWIASTEPLPRLLWRLRDWTAPNWCEQIRFHHARAFVFAG